MVRPVLLQPEVFATTNLLQNLRIQFGLRVWVLAITNLVQILKIQCPSILTT
jgi:hypothetical protein